MNIGVKQAAQLLNVSDKTIYRWLSNETIPYYRVGAQYRFSRNELLAWVAVNRGGRSPVAHTDMTEEDISLEQGLRAGGIFYRVDGTGVPDVLEQMISLMRLPEPVDPAQVFERVYQREQMGSTGIGEGIAMPHCRELPLAELASPVVSLGFLENPVDFKAIDNRPVSTVFLFLSPSPRSSIRMMSRLAGAVRQPEFLHRIRSVGTRDEIFAAASHVDQQAANEN